jgi:NADH-quinone oxidoreductase subunit L
VGLLWLIPTAPLAGFLILALAGRRLKPAMVGAVGAGSAGLSALIAIVVAAGFLSSPPTGGTYTQTLWAWMPVGNFNPSIAFYLDPLALIMMLVVSFVGFVIHFYSIEFMRGDDGYSRFFAYMNLFLASMLILVLADNLVLL